MELLKKLKPAKEMTLGLALGGGGVRGLAHAGVLSVLDRERIPIKAIAGSSIGAIVGATYSLNPEFSAKDFEEHVTELGVSVPIGISEKNADEESFLNRMRQFIEAERVIIDAALGWGVLPENKVRTFLKKLTRDQRLEEGRTQLAIVTTDLLSGDKIVFKEGPAAFAVQASSALPGFLPPLKFRNRLLADGAFVDMVPADEVRQMGVGVVLAVDVDQEGIQVEVRNGLEAFLRAVELCARHHKNHHLKMADLVIRPDFGQAVNPLDASKAELCVKAGIRAAEQLLPKIQELLT